jgi:hypothetical protein
MISVGEQITVVSVGHHNRPDADFLVHDKIVVEPCIVAPVRKVQVGITFAKHNIRLSRLAWPEGLRAAGH